MPSPLVSVGSRLLQRVHPGGREVALEQVRGPARLRRLRDRVQPRQGAQHRAQSVGRDVEPETVHRLVHPGAGPL